MSNMKVNGNCCHPMKVKIAIILRGGKRQKVVYMARHKDLVFSIVFLQLLLMIVIAMEVELAFDPECGPGDFKVMQNPRFTHIKCDFALKLLKFYTLS